MSIKFIHIVANSGISFLKLNKIPFVCLYHILLILLSIIKYLSCFCLLSIVNNTARNMGMQMSLRDPSFSSFGSVHRTGIAGSYVSLISWGTSIVFYSGCTSWWFHPKCRRVLFLPTSSSVLVTAYLFGNSHSDRCERISHCTFHLHFPDN